MNELEWLKQQSGLTDEELKQYETVLGDGKFKSMLKKLADANVSTEAARKKAETELEQFTNRYNNEFVPAMRDVTQQSIAAAGEAAALKAKLDKAKEFGIVIDEEPTAKPGETQRAPGSPDPNLISRDDFGRFSQQQANTIVALQDLNAEHFALYGAPLGNTQELVDEANRQRLLGNKNYNIKQAWEAKYNVAAKRSEVAAAEQKKHDDQIREVTRKEERERHSSNPNTRSGNTSRFSTYKPSEASSDKKPWQAPRSARERNTPWRESAKSKLREIAA
ncbi:MAG: hypothetical protein ABSC05_02670 [Candidatus Solibacter sp.]|jgi:hypothetical protein